MSSSPNNHRYSRKVVCPCPLRKFCYHHKLDSHGNILPYGKCFRYGCPFSAYTPCIGYKDHHDRSASSLPKPRRIVTEVRIHEYRTESDKQFMRVVVKKFDDGSKSAHCQRFVNGHWEYGSPPIDSRILYNLAMVIERVALGGTVVICEGEKDVDTLSSHNIVATCNPFGANNWQDRYSTCFVGIHVVVLPDNDAAGHKHAESVRHSVLAAGAASANILDLRTLDPALPNKGDVTDYFQRGGTIRQLTMAIDAAVLGGGL